MKKHYHWISIAILSILTGHSQNKIRKIYHSIIENECIPLSEIPVDIQSRYLSEYLLRDKLIDFSFLDSIKDYDSERPLYSSDVQKLFIEMKMLREGLHISRSYPDSATIHLQQLVKRYGISYSTFSRKRNIYMNNSSLYRALIHDSTSEDTNDRYKTCCFYCRDLIIYLHEKTGKLSSAKIYRDIKNAKPFPCKDCPYHPDVKKNSTNTPVATCQRNVDFMVKPQCDDTVLRIINRIPEQQDVLAWEGVRSWASKFHYTPAREKPSIVNQVWFSDHKRMDIYVRTQKRPDGTWIHQRPWLTAILDAASDAMVGYIISLNPNSDCIAECFARACAFTVDTPYCGIPDYFYIDNGKDYRSKKMDGLPNSEDDGCEHLYLNKEFGESGILEWFGVRVIHAMPYRGCSKTLERIWKTIDDEWIRKLPGYCGSSPEERPFILEEQMRNNETYTYEQFADYFADTIYPGYNDFSVTKESPNTLYARLPKASSYVPTWRTLAVLKSISTKRVIRQKGIQYGTSFYWCPELGPLVEKEDCTQYRIFAFDTPFNRTISVVHDHKFIGEAHLIEKLNVVEKKRYRVVQHVSEQAKQHRYYSKRLKQLHSVILKTDILRYVDDTPPVDNIRYGQAIDEEKDKATAIDDPAIPEELKEQAIDHEENYLNPEPDKNEPGKMASTLRELGVQARKKMVERSKSN